MFETQGMRLFSIAGIDVAFSSGFAFLMVIIIALNPSADGVFFAIALALSVLIHELGHAVVSKYYGLNPSILIHGFGGLCFHDEAQTDGRDALIVVMGPLVEIVAGLAAIGALLAIPTGALGPFEAARGFLQIFGAVSLVWGGINLLLPIWPLDGGRLMHLILRRFTDATKARRLALQISIPTAILAGGLGMWLGWYIAAFLAFFIILDNVQALQEDAPLVYRRGAKAERAKDQRANSFVEELLNEADEAFAHEEWREAARLCHQARAAGRISSKQMDRIWTTLGLATTELGEHREALDYLKRAPQTDAVLVAKARCEAARS